MRALLRTRGQYSIEDMFLQFKTHISGILESNIGGIYHATNTALAPHKLIDRLQSAFADNFNMNDATAFQRYNLAPLCFRRDVAMLGFLQNAIYQELIVMYCYCFHGALQDQVQGTTSNYGTS